MEYNKTPDQSETFRRCRKYSVCLKREMKEAGITNGQLAQRSGMSRQIIVFLRNEYREPTRSTVIALARGLNRPVSAFF